MASSDAEHLEALKIARDAIVLGMQSGKLTVDYMVKGRRHTVEASSQALERLEGLILTYERKVARSGRSTFRLASLQRARGRGC